MRSNRHSLTKASKRADYTASKEGFSIGRMTLQQKKDAKKKYQMRVGKPRRK